MDTQHQYITLSALAEKIRAAVEEYSGGDQWVVAEVSNVQVNYSGHCYLELTERNQGEQMPRAVCRAVIWGNRYKIISNYFRHSTGSDIEQGMKIMVKCSVTFHAVYGLSLVVSDIDPSYTLGEVERVRQQTISRLRNEGVLEMNRELELPLVIQKIAVISSATAAGYGDFANELENSSCKFDVTLFQAAMQGEGAVGSIVGALETIADTDEYDAVVIIRGGGSVNDLACFDNYDLCANVAQFPMPVITGIGHERDFSVADMVACLSLKTPTAVAKHLIDVAEEFINNLDQAINSIASRSQQIISNQKQAIVNLSLQLNNTVKGDIHKNIIKINTLESSFGHICSAFILRHSEQCEALKKEVASNAKELIREQISIQQKLIDDIKAITTNAFSLQKHAIEIAQMTVSANDPRRLLKRGYAIINGGLSEIDKVDVGSELRIELADGTIKAKVQGKWQKNN